MPKRQYFISNLPTVTVIKFNTAVLKNVHPDKNTEPALGFLTTSPRQREQYPFSILYCYWYVTKLLLSSLYSVHWLWTDALDAHFGTQLSINIPTHSPLYKGKFRSNILRVAQLPSLFTA